MSLIAQLHFITQLNCLQALDHQLRQRETALTTAEHRVELLRTRLENDALTTQKAAQAVEAERVEIKVCNGRLLHLCKYGIQVMLDAFLIFMLMLVPLAPAKPKLCPYLVSNHHRGTKAALPPDMQAAWCLRFTAMKAWNA